MWLKQNWRLALLVGVGSWAILLVIIQLAYPGDRLLPLASVDGQPFHSWSKSDVISRLDSSYSQQKVDIYFGDAKKPYRSPLPAQIGLSVTNKDRVEKLSYPWYLRLVPSSLFWAQQFSKSEQPTYTRSESKLHQYTEAELGSSCEVKPIDASLKANEADLVVVPAVSGGTCKLPDVERALKAITPKLNTPTKAHIDIVVVPPTVDDQMAKDLASRIEARLKDGLAVQAGASAIVIPAKEVISWLDFATTDGVLTPSLSSDRSADYLTKTIGPKVAVASGVSYITTRDFVELSRQDGASGQALALGQTLSSMLRYIQGETDEVVAATIVVPPREEYTRTYSPTDTGLSALLKQYADDHPGTYGISLVELSGQRRRASYNDSKQFITASTYKLFVAYSTLKRVEAGTWQWSDQISGGRDLTKCFDDMIVKSDNACAEALLQKIGFRPITSEMKALGLNQTTFLVGDSPLTTSGDLAIFLATLESGQMLTQPSRDRLLDAMKRNIYRQGIPAGVNGQVADKVGFLDGLLHDAAIVYSPQATYVLTIMTDGSSWANIADLSKKIDQLRSS